VDKIITFSRRLAHPEHGGIISKAIFLIFVIFVVFVLYVVRHPLLRAAGRIWIVDQAPEKSDAIVVLGGDNYEADRAARAAELFKAGLAPTVVASGRYLRSYASAAELTQRDLTERGVPTDHIIRLTHHAENTLDELVVIERVATQNNWKSVLIVTSNYHTRRSHMICSDIFPQGIAVRVVAAPDSDYNPDDWWQHRIGQRIFFHEALGYFVSEWEVRRLAAKNTNTNSIERGPPGSGGQGIFAAIFEGVGEPGGARP
jgi:uncharacterized SAM-binding protein YcdF (DUF218 family)